MPYVPIQHQLIASYFPLHIERLCCFLASRVIQLLGVYLCQHIALKSNLPWFVVDDGGRAQEAGGYYQIYPWRNVLPSWTVCNLPKLLLLLWWNSAHLIRIMLLTRHSFREEEMQELNRRTNSRMAWLGFLSLAICLSVAGLQLWHLKNFFERKKLLWFILLLTDKI